MSTTHDRDLLWGLFALRMKFIDQPRLLAALAAWRADKSRPLAEVLRAQGAIDSSKQNLLDQLVQKHLAQHNDDLRRGLAAMPIELPLRERIAALGDAEIEASLPLFAGDATRREDPLGATTAQATGAARKKIERAAEATRGRYRIVRFHARGGLGEISLARDLELGREVALKEIQPRYADDPEGRTRFVLEAEVTGGLEHPGIVPIYGLGRGDDGRPYYAMRFIRGESLRDALETLHQLPPEARAGFQLQQRKLLQRFIDVCNTVAYAHSRGVIHRDIKPDNIMLGPFGETLVVDWGLAKLVERGNSANALLATDESPLRPASSNDSSQTQAGSAVGTPAYMSPEQAGGLAEMVGPASDIYSLGATLYALLAGRPPIASGPVQQMLHDVLAGKITPPRQLDAGIPRDLEAICLKALAHNPRQRYASAADLRNDLEAWLADQPVSARRPPLVQRAARWMRRHRTLVTGAMAAGIVAVATLSASVVLLATARESERQAKVEAQTNLAESRRQQARAEAHFRLASDAVKQFYVQVSQDPDLQSQGLEQLRRRLLTMARKFYEQFAMQEPDSVPLRFDRAWAYLSLAEINGELKALPEMAGYNDLAMKEFIALETDFPDKTEPRRGKLKSLLNSAQASLQQEKIRPAVAAAGEAIALAQTLYIELPGDAEIIVDLAKAYGTRAMYELKVSAYARAVEDFGQEAIQLKKLPAALLANPETQRMLGAALSNHGVALKALGRLPEAADAYRQARAIAEKLVEQLPHSDAMQANLAQATNNLADVYFHQGDLEKAAAGFRTAAEIRKRLTFRHPEVPDFASKYADVLNNLGACYARMPKQDRAQKAAFGESIEIQTELVRKYPHIPDYLAALAATHSNLGNGLSELGDFGGAETSLRESLKLRKQLTDEYPEVPVHRHRQGATHTSLGHLLVTQKKYELAALEYRSAIELLAALVKQHAAAVQFQESLAAAYDGLATASKGLGQFDKAGDAHRESLRLAAALVESSQGDANYLAQWMGTLGNMARLAAQQQKHKQAIELFSQALERADREPERYAAHPSIKATARNLLGGRAASYTQLGQHAQAAKDWNRVIELGQPFAFLRLARGESLARAGDHAAAIADAEGSLAEVIRFQYPQDFYQLAKIYALSSALVAKNEKLPPVERGKLAESYALEALKMLRQAGTLKHFADPVQWKDLQESDDFHALRQRGDLKELLKELGGRKEGASLGK